MDRLGRLAAFAARFQVRPEIVKPNAAVRFLSSTGTTYPPAEFAGGRGRGMTFKTCEAIRAAFSPTNKILQSLGEQDVGDHSSREPANRARLASGLVLLFLLCVADGLPSADLHVVYSRRQY